MAPCGSESAQLGERMGNKGLDLMFGGGRDELRGEGCYDLLPQYLRLACPPNSLLSGGKA